jgi:hypothetical protein
MTPDPADPRALLAEVMAELLDKIEELDHADRSINPDGPLFRKARAALAAASLPAQQRPAPESGAGNEVIERAARAAHDAVRAPAPTNWVGSMRDEYWFPIARAVLAAAQPAPPADTVSVLDGLLAEMREVAASYRVLSRDGHEGVDGLAEAWNAAVDMVEAARRRLGGEN